MAKKTGPSNVINLRQFCGSSDARDYLRQPWTRGDFTYATNGHICVAVQRRADIPENDAAPNAESLFEAAKFERSFEILRCPLTTETFSECPNCNGRKTEHDCPKCTCVCEQCDGEGKVSDDGQGVSVGLLGSNFSSRYIRQTLKLPNLRVFAPEDTASPIGFTFDGGRGVVMPMRAARLHHIDAVVADV